jgi:hypothetical protein
MSFTFHLFQSIFQINTNNSFSLTSPQQYFFTHNSNPYSLSFFTFHSSNHSIYLFCFFWCHLYQLLFFFFLIEMVFQLFFCAVHCRRFFTNPFVQFVQPSQKILDIDFLAFCGTVSVKIPNIN